MSDRHDAAGASRRASVHGRAAALEDRLRALATDLDDEPSPDFRAATRARLVAMAAVRSPQPEPRRGLARLAAARPVRRRRAWRARLAAGVAGAAVAVTALGTLVALSTDAEPGDTLYGLKRGTEQTQLALAGDQRGLTLLGLATTRLHELDRLADSSGAPPVDLVLDTLATMDAQTSEGAALALSQAVAAGDAGSLSVISGWAQDQGDGLAGLRAVLPGDAGDAASRSLGLVGDVGTRAEELRAALDCPTGVAVAGTDDLGPVPAPCAAPATPDPSAPADPTTGTNAPVPDEPAAPPSSPAPSSPAPSGAPASPSPDSGSPGSTGSGGTGPGGGSAPSGGGGGPTTSPPPPGGGLPLPVPPLPVPGGGGRPSVPSVPSVPSPVPVPPSAPVLDLPLPVCLWPIVC
ncbi:DUF5667 domain-containing protein [Geodermatophilus amargosae]|uniref:DUF5667 domain-containing protein n=1 Tax=Geodermatophilus amargosae TaxID=1296565 RepID=UPI0034DDED18